MEEQNITELVELLQKDIVPKSELISSIDKIKFKSNTPIMKGETNLNSKETFDKLIKTTFKATKANSVNANRDLKIMNKCSTEKSLSSTKSKIHGKDINESTKIKPEKTSVLYKGEHSPIPDNDKRKNVKLADRIVLDKFYRESLTNLKKSELDKEEMKECTFKPKTNLKRSSSKFTEETKLRLYEQHKLNLILNKVKRDIDYNNEYKEIEQCTFHPTINSTTAKSRYMSDIICDTNQRLINNKSSTSLKETENEFSFKPEITKYPNSDKKMKEYLNNKAYLRLSQSAAKLQKPCSPPNINENKPTDFNKFLDRQKEFEMMKKCKKQTIIDHLEIKPVKKINNNSKEMMHSLICLNKTSNVTINKSDKTAFSKKLDPKSIDSGKPKVTNDDLIINKTKVKPQQLNKAKDMSKYNIALSNKDMFYKPASISKFKLIQETELNYMKPFVSIKTQDIISKLRTQIDSCKEIVADPISAIKTDNNTYSKSQNCPNSMITSPNDNEHVIS